MIYAHSLTGQPVNGFVAKQYNRQKHRGTEGFGLFDGQEMNMVHEPGEKRIKRWLQRYKSNVIMFHHRNPTSTINVKRACHPFSTKDYFGKTQYVLIHNGYIWNADDMFVEHQELGIQYQSLLQDLTFNDSEALLWDFALYMEGKITEMQSRGAIAFICMKLVDGKLTDLYFDRNTNPLFMRHNGKGLFLSSEGQGESIKPGSLYRYEYATDKIYVSELELRNYTSATTYGKDSKHHYSSGPHVPYNDLDEAEDWGSWSNRQWAGELHPIDTPEPTPIRGGTWLSEGLKKKFNVKHVIEYEDAADGSGIMVPVSKPIYSLKTPDASNLVLSHLIESKGNFEGAYQSLEKEYIKIVTKNQTPERRARVIALEDALSLISSDEEYVNEKSISSIWRSLWNQKQLVA